MTSTLSTVQANWFRLWWCKTFPHFFFSFRYFHLFFIHVTYDLVQVTASNGGNMLPTSAISLNRRTAVTVTLSQRKNERLYPISFTANGKDKSDNILLIRVIARSSFNTSTGPIFGSQVTISSR